MPQPNNGQTRHTGGQPPRRPMGIGGGPPGGRLGGMGSTERADDTRGTIRRLWSYLYRQRLGLAAVTVMVMFTTLLQMLAPWLMGKAIDDYILPGDLHGLFRICLLMLTMYGLLSLFTWLTLYVMAGIGQHAVRDMREDLFDNMTTLSLRFFDTHSHGDLMSRYTNDMENINRVLSESLSQLVSGVMLLVGISAMMLWINPILAAVVLITTPFLVFVVARYVGKRTRVGFRRQQASLGDLNGLIEETITGQRIVKAFVREEQAIEEFDQTNQELRKNATRAQIYSGFMGPVMNFISRLTVAIVVTAGAAMAVMGMATVGTVASFINYTRQFGRPLSEIANLYNQIQAAIAGAERVFELIDEKPEIVDKENAISLTDMRGDVRMEDVGFAYDENVPVLKHVNLHANPGETVALVGPTGGGKTTIVNMLSRFYDINEGRILFDGNEIRDIRKEDLRRQLGVVLQDTFLFSGTVRENIRYGRLDATDAEVEAAAKMANADPFIHRLPHGYDTMLSEQAGNLSEGQRQMLAISRAILANPSILILDEATSSVDTRTEQQIQEAMLRLMQGRTNFVIAHRLSTIRNADQILMVHDGEILERGKHNELLARGGHYSDLYMSQMWATAPMALEDEFIN